MNTSHRPPYRVLLHYVSQVRVPFAVSFLLLFIIAGLTAAKAWVIQPVVDTFLGGTTSSRQLFLLCLLVVAIFLLQALLNWLYAIIARVASASVVRNIRTDLFAHLTRQSLGYYATRPSADLASRVVNDVAAFETSAVESVQILVRDLATVAMLMTVLLLKEWRLALLSLGIIFGIGIVLRRMSVQMQALGRKAQTMVGRLTKELTEMIGGIDLILGFGLGATWKARFEQVNQEHYETEIRATRTRGSAMMLVQVLIGLSISGILLVTGAALLEGRISAGDFGTFLGAIYLMQTPAINIGNSIAGIARGGAAAGRALELLQDQPTVLDPEQPLPIPSEAPRVEFDRVSFGYKNDQHVLRDLSFTVEPGELVVVVGDSGAGKSTIARLLLRFYDPDAGEVRIGGVPLLSVSRSDLYQHVSYVSQDIYLFNGTVDFNLRVGKPDATDEEVAAALDLAGATAFIAGLPNGLNTHVGERGVQLSGGQRQRIAIARAVLTDARILVMDEATSALDMKLEQKILQNLVTGAAQRTIIAISHRLSIAEISDRVLVLRDGTLVEEGSADSLGRQDGEFNRLRKAADERLVRGDHHPSTDSTVPRVPFASGDSAVASPTRSPSVAEPATIQHGATSRPQWSVEIQSRRLGWLARLRRKLATGYLLPWRYSHLGGPLNTMLLVRLRRWRLLRTVKTLKTEPETITVVIAVRDRRDYRLRNAFACIRAQDYPQDLIEVLLVDYDSRPENASVLKKITEDYGVGYMRASERGEWNKSHALNIAIKAAVTSKYTLITDVDVMLAPNYIREVVAALQHDPLSAVYSQLLDLPESCNSELAAAAERGDVPALNRLRSRGVPRSSGLHSPGTFSTLTYYLRLVRGYDEFYFKWGFEDTDLDKRLLYLGLTPVSIADRSFYLHQWHPRFEGVGDAKLERTVIANSRYFLSKQSIFRNAAGWGEATFNRREKIED